MTTARKVKTRGPKRLPTPVPVPVPRKPNAAQALELEALIEDVDRRLEELLADSREILRALEPRGGP